MPPDTRHEKCPKKVLGDYSSHAVSIIIPWHKEKWLHLRHTLEALEHFTPPGLVEEYIFVSDGNADSKEKELKAISSKVKVIAFAERQGLIRAKSAAVRTATAPVIMFLEGHCIVNRYWLQPLLERVVQNPKALVMPVLDMIPQAAWGDYKTGSTSHQWRYEWNMNLIHTNPLREKRDGYSVYTSPGTSGGIFVIRKDWFLALEFFDEGMLEWGGDHAELSFKTWRCGGTIEVVPCSRIGHLFRNPEYRPYPVEVDQVVKNYDRLARLWWKDHLEYFRRMKPETRKFPAPNLTVAEESYTRVQEKFQCKDHQWYLDNIDHEMAWEMTRLCHPHVKGDDPDKCKGELLPGRWTIVAEDEIPKEEYLERKKAADERLAAAKRAETDLEL